MCGLVGILVGGGGSVPINDIVEDMASTLIHRGPDSSGTWVDKSHGVGFSHRRLSIVDQTSHGHQPMISRDTRFVLSFNGEVYNHLEVRSLLEKETGLFGWKGHSDTETLVEAIAHWGVEKTLRELVGMFSISLWDRHNSELTLARDRFGEKPLYFRLSHQTLAFSSELKAMRKVPGWTFSINPQAVASLVTFSYVPEPHSIFESVSKVPAGTYITFRQNDVAINQIPLPRPYWSFTDVARHQVGHQSQNTSLTDAVETLDYLLSRSVEGQLMGDVPVGAFLSGGIDSSTIVALMQKVSRNPVNTFSVGFAESRYDESRYAEAVAQHLGTNHSSIIVTSTDAKSTLPQLAEIYDEPFADSSQIPTYLVSKLAREQVTVSLSGDGGDELFGGYVRYSAGALRWSALSQIPLPIREKIASFLRYSANQRMVPMSPRLRTTVKKAGEALPSSSARSMFRNFTTTGEGKLLLGDVAELSSKFQDTWPIETDLSQQMMAIDTLEYLPGDILVKVDRASMAHSLETRMPFLDHRVVEFAWALPLAMKIDNRESKIVLRRLLGKYVPPSLFERPKMGLSVPLAKWLRGPLENWAEELLSPQLLESSGFFNVVEVRKQWAKHVEGSGDHSLSLWNVLMFQAWYQASEKRYSDCEHS